MGWSQKRLGRAVGLSESVINAFEHDGYLPSPAETWLAEIRTEFEQAGIEFVDDVPGVPFVRLRKAEV
jgi:ribosome-binding protein aMBF1 (putative translation factor)